ncbi:hypothetical protein [Mycobacterium sp. SMC-19]|uniref:hypothetical protein n=1 Tax=Mycobacterium sp. SMC-19 TaxID=3381630 RepID=UPI0038778D0F
MIDDDDLTWLARTPWLDPCLDSRAVAAVLEVQEQTIRQYVASNAPGFPAPAARESGRNRWTPDQLFRYITTYRPQLAHRIPRLYSPHASIVPARFLYAEPIKVLRPVGNPMARTPVEFAVHHWQPADGRGTVAIAYPEPIGETGWDYAHLLLEALPSVSAVALITDQVSVPHDRDGWQATIAVAERGTPALRELDIPQPVEGKVAEWGWYTLANLLRVDIPWWSPLLRDIAHMVAWFPGAPRQKIRPRSAFIDETHLLGLARYVPREDAARVTELANEFYRHLEGADISVLPCGESTDRPGLLQAAEPLHRLPEIPDIPDVGDIRWLLHRPVYDTAVAIRASYALDGVPGIDRVVANIITVDNEINGPLASLWLDDLIPADPHELGFAFARRGGASSEQIVGHFTHRRDPHVWAVETVDHDFHITVAQQVQATGQLVEFELHAYSGFFRDSNGEAWPIPILNHRCGYNSGYGGSGPQDLCDAVSALRRDAGVDLNLAKPISRYNDLWKFIRAQSPPLTVDPELLDELTQG